MNEDIPAVREGLELDALIKYLEWEAEHPMPPEYKVDYGT